MRPDLATNQNPSLKIYIVSFLFILLFSTSAFSQIVDCSITTNCGNSYCNYAATIEKGCRCFDGVDNDGDGLTDKADLQCAEFYGLTFVGSEDGDCSLVAPTGNPFAAMSLPIVSGQNTADTQSKVSVGDVDGDGIPDVIITSKWNSEIRVVATKAHTVNGVTYAAGDIKSDFKTTGQGAKIFSGTGDCSPKNLLFEHENLIADIDDDGVAEIYGIVSNRSGNPSSPPTCFFLVGFKYVAGDLQPLFNAIQIGTDRPGVFGIADMDGDGKAELYMRDRIYAAETGALLATGNGDWDLDITSGPVAVDVVKGDGGKMELVCGTKIYSIPSFASRNPAAPATLTLAKDMNTVPGASGKCYVKLATDLIEYGEDTHSMCSVADIDNDGNVDVVISGALNSATGKTAVFYWNVAKQIVSHFVVPDAVYPDGWPWGTGRINLMDSDNDKVLDLFFVAGSTLFRVEPVGDAFDANINTSTYSTYVKTRTINDSRSGVLTVTLYDFNNDGNFELVYRDSQELVVVDAPTLQTKYWSATCQSHTYTEGPVIADVNGDGKTDICVPCNRNNSFDIQDPIQQQALGEVRLFFSNDGTTWLPTRKVWNQPGYFIINVNDDLSLPFPQYDQTTIFSTETCTSNGLSGPQRPLNVFLNQVPYLSASGCPVYPSPDLTYYGDDPEQPGVDTNGDGILKSSVTVTPPICGNTDVKAEFYLINSGLLPIAASVPVSFYNGNPTLGPSQSTILHTTTLNIALGVGQNTSLNPIVATFNGPGREFDLYIVLNNTGFPVPATGQSGTDCDLQNNIIQVTVSPQPFNAVVELVSNNTKCIDGADTGELRVRLYKGPVGTNEVTDYSQYSFQWNTGPVTGYTAMPGEVNYNITGKPDGPYTVIATNTLGECSSAPAEGVIAPDPQTPEVSINVISEQTKCSPYNGELEAVVVGGNIGVTFEWFSEGNSLNVTTPKISGLAGGANYLVRATKAGCPNTATYELQSPGHPEAQAFTVDDVTTCNDPNGGRISALPVVNAVPLPAADTANYNFHWYFYPNGSRGSILPLGTETNPTRSGLAAGTYEVVITDIASNCESITGPFTTTVESFLISPEANVLPLQTQTSCDPNNPNGSLEAVVMLNGIAQDPALYTFEWFAGQNTLPANAHNETGEVSGTNNRIAEKVSGGGQAYTVRATHIETSCFATNFGVVLENINHPVLDLVQTPNSVCDPLLAAGAYNGTLTASVTFEGNTVTLPNTNYEIAWYDGSLTTDPDISTLDKTQPILTGLNGGKNYTAVVMRTDLSCQSTPFTRQVINDKVLPGITFTPTASTTCAGFLPQNGSITATVTNVTPGNTYAYTWTGIPIANGGNTANVINLQGGLSYEITVTNTTTGCSNTHSTPLADNSAKPTIELIPTSNTICDPLIGFNGEIQANILTNPNFIAGHTMRVDWSTGATAVNPITGLNGDNTYSATITNASLGCTSDPVSVLVNNEQILPDIIYTATPSTNCEPTLANGGIISEVNVNGTATTTGYTFEWSNASGTIIPGIPLQPWAIAGVNGGQNYTLTVTTDATGCENTQVIPLQDISASPVIQLNPSPNMFCDPAKFNGEIEAVFLSNPNAEATHTYTYAWVNVTAGNVVLTEAGASITGKDGGDYTGKVRNNALGCESEIIPATIINQKVLPDIEITPHAATNCDVNKPNGELNAVINIGAGVTTTTGYTFVWDTGETGSDLIDKNGNATFLVTATNSTTGCVASQQMFLPAQPAKPVLTAVGGINTVCDSDKGYTGSATTTFFSNPNGEAPPLHTYNYTWRDATNTLVTNPDGVNAPNIVTGLNGGTYTVVVENVTLGCISELTTFDVKQNLILPEILATSIASTNCPGGSVDGELNASVTNGVASETFTFQWYRDVVDTDDTKKVGTLEAHLTGQQGGLHVYYTVNAENDITGCEAVETIALNDEHVLPVFTISTVDNTGCLPAKANGSVTASLVAGTSYTYTWFNETSASSITDIDEAIEFLMLGNYSAVVKDLATGCSSAKVFAAVKDIPYVPVIDIASVPQTMCVGNNGQVTATIDETQFGNGTGITAGYTFEWFLNNTSQTTSNDWQNIDGNITYEVRVEHTATGCQNNEFIFLPENLNYPVLDVALTNITDCTIPGRIDATVSLIDTNNDGTPDPIAAADYANYSFSWFFGKTSAGADISTVSTDATVNDRTLDPLTFEGDYAVKVIHNVTQCPSTEYTIFAEAPKLFNFKLRTIIPATSCGTDEGVMTADVYDNNNVRINPVGYTFEWYRGYPTNSPPANFYTHPPVAFNGGVLPTDPINESANYTFDNIDFFDPATGRTIYGYTADNYTVVATNPNGCKEFLTDNLEFRDEPIVITPRVLPDICGVDGGQITVDVDAKTNTGSESLYNVYLFEGMNPTLNPPAEPTGPGAPPNNYMTKIPGVDNQTLYTFTGLAAKIYTVVVQEDPASLSSGCFSSPLLVEVEEALPPMVNVLSFVSSTSCGAAPGDGALKIEILTDPNDPYDPYNNLPLPAGSILDPAGTPPTYQIELFNSANVLVDPYDPTAYIYSDADQVNLTNLKSDDYTIRITSSMGCVFDKAVSLPNTPGIPQPIDNALQITDAAYCDPALETSAAVKITGIEQVNGTVEATENFTFSWYADPAMTLPLYSSVGNATQTLGELLNNTKTTQGEVTAGDYYILMEKTVATTTGGLGCSSAPVKVVIDDASVNPVITLTPMANTACSPIFFEGQIELAVATTGPVGYPGNDPTATYTFDNWTSLNGSATPASASVQPANPAAYVGLKDDTYSLRVRNEITGCIATGQTEILRTSVPVFTLDLTSIAQVTCPTGGSATVTKIYHPNDPATALAFADYTLTWHQVPFGTALQQGGVDIHDATLNSVNFPTIGTGEFYAVAERTAGTDLGRGCTTAPIRVVIQDQRVYPTVTLQGFSNTSCDNTVFEGSISALFQTNGVAGRQYDILSWTASGGAATPAVTNAYSQGTTYNLVNMDEDTYTVTFRDNTSNCTGTGSVTVEPQRQPIFILDADVTSKLLCRNDGEMEVTEVSMDGLTPVANSNFTFEWYINDAIPANQITVNDAASVLLNVNNYANMNNGTYYAVAVRTNGPTTPAHLPGAGCKSAPFKAIVPDETVKPTLALNNTANKNCDPATYNGSITFIPANTNPHAGAASLGYSYTFLAMPPDATVNNPADGPGPVSTIATDIVAPGTYNVEVMDLFTTCKTSGSTIVLDQPQPVEILQLTKTDQDLCRASGSLIIDAVTTPNTSAEYDFVWRKGTSTSPNIQDDLGNDITLASLLPGNGAGQYSAMGGGTYFVIGRKRSTATGDGKGCYTPAFKEVINDLSEKPQITFSTISNTACNGNFDAQITVTTTHPKGNDNSFTWLTSPIGSNAATNPINRNGLVATTNFTTSTPEIVSPGVYTIRVTNENSSCENTGTVEVLNQPIPLEIINHTKHDQDICLRPDGDITVTALNVGTIANYTYTWYLDNPASTPLADNMGDAITGQSLLPGTGANQYALMGAGSYYVVATKNIVAGTGSSSGCETPPYRIVIDDLHTDPRISFASMANSSCNMNGNGSVTGNAFEQDGTSETYSFVWTHNGNPIGSPSNGSTSTITDALHGEYMLTATNTTTGCDVTSDFNLILDETRSRPNIIDIMIDHPEDCLPSGSAEVTRITLGSPTNSILIPPNTSNEIIGAGLMNYTYMWYAGAVANGNQLPKDGPPFTETPGINGLGAGTYFVIVKDIITDCESTEKEVVINADQIIYPIVDISLTQRQLNCDEPNNGGTAALFVEADHGKPGNSIDNPSGFEFKWFENSLDTVGNVFQTAADIQNLKSGNYAVWVRDVTTNCKAKSFYIIQPDAPRFLPQLAVSSAARMNCVVADGTIYARGVPYPIDPVPINNYPFPYDYEVTYTPASAAMQPDATNPNTDFFATGLDIGMYSVTLLDKNTGCKTTLPVEIADDLIEPEIAVTVDNPLINCDPAIANGQLSVDVINDDTQATGGYNYIWNAGQSYDPGNEVKSTNNKLIGANRTESAGLYIVRVENKITQCFTLQVGEVTDGRVPAPTPTPELIQHDTRCDTDDGSVTATVGGVTFNYLFAWNNGSSSVIPDLGGLGAGSHSVVAIDATTGCESLPATIAVEDQSVIPQLVFFTTPSYCEDVPTIHGGSGVGTGTIELQINPADLVSDQVVWTSLEDNSYAGIGNYAIELLPGFYRADVTTTKGCTNSGEAEVKTEILSYNLVSRNNDSKNDAFVIDCISRFPNNNVKIFNRSGVLVYEADGYNNNEFVFDGFGQKGIYTSGNDLPVGTYFYIIDKGDGSKPKTGYLELVK